MAKARRRPVDDQLLQIARESLRVFLLHRQCYQPPLEELPSPLCRPASTFVTLYREKKLRGCIGSTGARYPLATDVARNAAAAARDPRFPPVRAGELPAIRLEISILGPPQPLVYDNYKDLLAQLRPGEDGVIISWQEQRALLLPQVWTRVPEPADFLQALCSKGHIPLRMFRAIPPAVKVEKFEAYLIEDDDHATN